MWNLLSVCIYKTLYICKWVQVSFHFINTKYQTASPLNHAPTISEVALGWDFLGLPNPQWMWIFHFGRDQKIPGDLKSLEWGSGIWDPQKSPVKNSQKSPKNPQSLDIYTWGFRIFYNLGIFIQGIGNFLKSGDRGFFQIWGFLSRGFFWDEDFSGMGIFFRGIGYPIKKPPLHYLMNTRMLIRTSQYSLFENAFI